MLILLYDETFEGFLTAVFEVYRRKAHQGKDEAIIEKESRYSGSLFAQVEHCDTNAAHAERVTKRLVKVLGKRGFKDLWRAWLSELADADEVIFGVIRHALKSKGPVLGDYNEPHVMRLQRILKMVSRERHRMTAFVRFEEDSNGLYFALIKPDFNVLPLIAAHFKSRYADQQWMIFDEQRKYGIHYDLSTLRTVELMATETGINALAPMWSFSEREREYQKLWKAYFKHTDIRERRNMKLHLQHVPRRYWRYLTEKQL